MVWLIFHQECFIIWISLVSFCCFAEHWEWRAFLSCSSSFLQNLTNILLYLARCRALQLMPFYLVTDSCNSFRFVMANSVSNKHRGYGKHYSGPQIRFGYSLLFPIYNSKMVSKSSFRYPKIMHLVKFSLLLPLQLIERGFILSERHNSHPNTTSASVWHAAMVPQQQLGVVADSRNWHRSR